MKIAIDFIETYTLMRKYIDAKIVRVSAMNILFFSHCCCWHAGTLGSALPPPPAITGISGDSSKGDKFYAWRHGIFQNRDMPLKIHVKFYKEVILNTLLWCCKTWGMSIRKAAASRQNEHVSSLIPVEETVQSVL